MANQNLSSMIKDITYFYIKHYYDKLLTEKNKNKLTQVELRNFINEMYVEKQIELKKYIRDTLKDNLGEQYSTLTTENILLELFKDPEYAKERVFQEILLYQNNK